MISRIVSIKFTSVLVVGIAFSSLSHSYPDHMSAKHPAGGNGYNEAMPEAVIFDLDGVLADSEHLWNEAKEALTEEAGGIWSTEAPMAMLGMSSPEWTVYMHRELKVPLSPEEINRLILAQMSQLYRERRPVFPDATQVVTAVAARWPVGLASSSNREIIDLFLEVSGLEGRFTATVSSEEVARGKPSPDVYLEAARQIGVPAHRCVAVEDSGNGLRAAMAAGMRAIAIPNRDYPPTEDVLSLAAIQVQAISQVTAELIERVAVTA
jgi:HAD superfamily hydrolase (TIGR01509 family)